MVWRVIEHGYFKVTGPIDITLEISDTLSAGLDRAITAGTDLSPAMRDIAGHLSFAAQERFETSRNPLGVPWKPSQRVIDEGGKTLVKSGDLVGSIIEDWGADFAAAGPEASGGAAVYAAIHQLGGTILPRAAKALSFGGRIVSRVVIPAREYLGWNEESEAYAIDTLVAFLKGAFNGDAALPDGAA